MHNHSLSRFGTCISIKKEKVTGIHFGDKYLKLVTFTLYVNCKFCKKKRGGGEKIFAIELDNYV
jgi:hypothetical protein